MTRHAYLMGLVIAAVICFTVWRLTPALDECARHGSGLEIGATIRASCVGVRD